MSCDILSASDWCHLLIHFSILVIGNEQQRLRQDSEPAQSQSVFRPVPVISPDVTGLRSVWIDPLKYSRHTDLTPGGSSGGESALIAVHGSPLGIGTDIGGSIVRISRDLSCVCDRAVPTL